MEAEAEIGAAEESEPSKPPPGPRLRFCPESNDLLYPKEDRERKVLVFQCQNCDYKEDAPRSDWCVYRNEITHSHKEKTVVLQDVSADPTLPRTRDVQCAKCQHNEAVFFSAATEEGMTLFFNCIKCGHRWRDYV
ncbi:hypothetical protein WJX81_007830 [Elliptochloris bilobata]|uniref:DNA-directed RNA polymerase subunit n=1 Tax=Elliptochloris bilobata TaxID=381761 RepID=A0AAW1RED6_9CHLO